MIVLRDYDKEKCIDRVWYDSSNIFYTECEDKKDSLKTLRVVFNNGSTYEYYNIDVNDYLMFVHGGMNGSNGNGFNEFIKKKKYEYKKIEPFDKQLLTEVRDELIDEKKKKKLEEEKKKEEEN